MSNFDSGVKGYVIGTATVKTGFPIDWHGTPHISCTQCKFYSITSRRCQLNKELIAFPEKYTGDLCPLKLEETEVLENGED